jgi:hypothetical protein
MARKASRIPDFRAATRMFEEQVETAAAGPIRSRVGEFAVLVHERRERGITAVPRVDVQNNEPACGTGWHRDACSTTCG